MKKILLLLLLLPNVILSQDFIVTDLNVNNYPIVQLKYYTFKDNSLLTVKKKDFSFKDTSYKIIKFSSPHQTFRPQPLSIVLTFDVSGSMYNENMEIAKEAALTFIKLTPLDVDEIAITSFDDANYLNLDFSRDRQKIIKAVADLKAMGGTDYDKGFIEAPGGGITLFPEKNSQSKRVMIFLTDGLGNGSVSKIIYQAKEKGITVFPVVVGMKAPDILKEIAKKTHGKYYEEVATTEQAKNIYLEILNYMSNNLPGSMTIKLPQKCNAKKQLLTIYLKNVPFDILIDIPQKKQIKILKSADFVDFGKINPGDSTTKIIKLTPQNSDFKILSISQKHSDIFRITKFKYPFTLRKNTQQAIKITYKAIDTNFIYDQLQIKNDICNPLKINLQANTSPLAKGNFKITRPNGGETFFVGASEKIRWEGIGSFDSVKLYISADGGITYKSLGKGTGLTKKITVPNLQSDSCLVKGVVFYNAPFISSLDNNSNIRHLFFGKNQDLYLLAPASTSVWDMKNSSFNKISSARITNRYTTNKNKDKLMTYSFRYFNVIYLKQNSAKSVKPKEFLGIKYFKPSKAPIIYAGFDNSDQIIIVEKNGKATIWDNKAQKKLSKQKLLNDKKTTFFKSYDFPKNNVMAFVSNKRELMLYDKNSFQLLYSAKINSIPYSCSESQNSLFFADKNKIYKFSIGKKTFTDTLIYNTPIKKFLVSGNEQKLYLLNDKGLTIYSLKSGQKTNFIQGRFRDFAVSENGKNITTLGPQKIIIQQTKKTFKQYDISDNFFQIAGTLPKIKNVTIPQTFTGQTSSSYVVSFIKNDALYPVTIDSIYFTGPNSNKFFITTGFPPFTLAPKSAKNVEFAYQSAYPATDIDTINVVIGGSIIKSIITASAVPPPFVVNNTVINFGKLKKGQSKTMQKAIFTNTSDKPLQITAVILSGNRKNFKILTKMKRQIIKPGETFYLKSQFTVIEPKRNLLTIKFLIDNINTPVNIYLIGEGIIPKDVTLLAKAIDFITGKPIKKAKLTVIDTRSNRITKIDKYNSGKQFKQKLNLDRTYEVTVSAKGYHSESTTIDLNGYVTQNKIQKNFMLMPDLSQIDTLKLRFNFETAQYTLTPEAKEVMNRIAVYMKRYKSVKLKINGYTDNEGSEQYNLNLSKHRANSVKNYLVSKGVAHNRITTKGYGNKRPVANNASEEGKMKNRRVEIIFLR